MYLATSVSPVERELENFERQVGVRPTSKSLGNIFEYTKREGFLPQFTLDILEQRKLIIPDLISPENSKEWAPSIELQRRILDEIKNSIVYLTEQVTEWEPKYAEIFTGSVLERSFPFVNHFKGNQKKPSKSTPYTLEQLVEYRLNCEELITTIDKLDDKDKTEMRGRFDPNRFKNPFAFATMVITNNITALTLGEYDQSMLQWKKPWWDLSKFITGFLVPKNSFVASNFDSAEYKVAQRELDALRGDPLTRISKREMASAKATKSQYIWLSTDYTIMDNETLQSTEKAEYSRLLYTLGFCVSRRTVEQAAHVLSTTERIIEGFVYSIVSGHDSSLFSKLQKLPSTLWPFPSMGDRGH
jgi:hypothetical protein